MTVTDKHRVCPVCGAVDGVLVVTDEDDLYQFGTPMGTEDVPPGAPFLEPINPLYRKGSDMLRHNPRRK